MQQKQHDDELQEQEGLSLSDEPFPTFMGCWNQDTLPKVQHGDTSMATARYGKTVCRQSTAELEKNARTLQDEKEYRQMRNFENPMTWMRIDLKCQFG